MAVESRSGKPADQARTAPHGESLGAGQHQGITSLPGEKVAPGEIPSGLREQTILPIDSPDALIKATARKGAIEGGIEVTQIILSEMDTDRPFRKVPATGGLDEAMAFADAIGVRDTAKAQLEAELERLGAAQTDTEQKLLEGATFYPAAVERVSDVTTRLEQHQSGIDTGSALYERVADSITTATNVRARLEALPQDVPGFADAVGIQLPEKQQASDSPPAPAEKVVPERPTERSIDTAAAVLATEQAPQEERTEPTRKVTIEKGQGVWKINDGASHPSDAPQTLRGEKSRELLGFFIDHAGEPIDKSALDAFIQAGGSTTDASVAVHNLKRQMGDLSDTDPLVKTPKTGSGAGQYILDLQGREFDIVESDGSRRTISAPVAHAEAPIIAPTDAPSAETVVPGVSDGQVDTTPAAVVNAAEPPKRTERLVPQGVTEDELASMQTDLTGRRPDVVRAIGTEGATVQDVLEAAYPGETFDDAGTKLKTLISRTRADLESQGYKLDGTVHEDGTGDLKIVKMVAASAEAVVPGAPENTSGVEQGTAGADAPALTPDRVTVDGNAGAVTIETAGDGATSTKLLEYDSTGDLVKDGRGVDLTPRAQLLVGAMLVNDGPMDKKEVRKVTGLSEEDLNKAIVEAKDDLGEHGVDVLLRIAQGTVELVQREPTEPRVREDRREEQAVELPTFMHEGEEVLGKKGALLERLDPMNGQVVTNAELMEAIGAKNNNELSANMKEVRAWLQDHGMDLQYVVSGSGVRAADARFVGPIQEGQVDVTVVGEHLIIGDKEVTLGAEGFFLLPRLKLGAHESILEKTVAFSDASAADVVAGLNEVIEAQTGKSDAIVRKEDPTFGAFYVAEGIKVNAVLDHVPSRATHLSALNTLIEGGSKEDVLLLE